MKAARGVSLQRYNCFGVPATAARAVQIDSLEDLRGQTFDPQRDLVLGGGSNVLLAGDIEGTVFLNRIRGMRLVALDEDSAVVEAGAGEIWHSLVLWSLAQGLNGLENLSLIPGLCGAAPIQNIGAYGVELADLLDSVEAWEWPAGRLVRIPNRDCGFGYRDSRFKSRDTQRYLITSIRLRLSRSFRPRLSYPGLIDQLAAMGIAEPSAQQVSRAVIALRKRRLPNPARLGNAGSFFQNPIVDPGQAETLRRRFEGLPVHDLGPRAAKLSAAWMIEHCGWKGYRDGDAGVSAQHALVLVNHGRASGQDILSLAGKIMQSVEETFGIRLQPEPVIVGV
jgi:UDP-N-acetylmuramate dehydrogenase